MKSIPKKPARIIITMLISLAAIPALVFALIVLRPILLFAIPIIIITYALAYAFSSKIRGKSPYTSFSKFILSGFHVPQEVFFHSSHSWTKPESTKRFAVGVDDFMQKVLGPLKEIRTPPVGTRVCQGEKIFQLKSTNRSVDVQSPVDGIVCSINKKLMQSPAIINNAPYSKGWVVKLRPNNIAENIKVLRAAHEAREWFRNEMESLQTLLTPQMLSAHVMQDGGSMIEDLWHNLDNETWLRIKTHFFQNTK